MGALYDVDVLEWSEHQARLLRQHAKGGPSNEAPDWANIIEEIESVGRSQIDAIESWWFQAFLHDLKAAAWPAVRDAPSWAGEARGFRAQARRKYRPSMREKFDLASIYADALSALPATMDNLPPLAVSPCFPVTLDVLLGGEA